MFNNLSITTVLDQTWLRWALGVLLAGVAGSYFFWPASTDVKTLVLAPQEFLQQVSVSGKVTAAQSVDLAFSQTGRVSAVHAKVGDLVAAGQVIASIENGDAYADILQKEAAYESALATLASLVDGTRPEQIAVTQSSVASAEAALEEAREALMNEIRDAFTTADDAVRNKVDQLFSNPRTNAPQINISTGAQSRSTIESNRAGIEEDLVEWADLVGTLSTTSDLPEAAQTATAYLKNISTFLQTMSLVVSDVQPNGTLTQTIIDKYRTDIAAARTNVSAAQTAITSAVTGYRNDQAALVTAEKKLLLEEAGATPEDIKAQEAQVKAALADLEKVRALYRKTIITAPFSGTVTRMDAKVGAVASSNASLISMISQDVLQIESFVPEINTPLLEVGDSALVLLDAYGEALPFSASIVSIDPAETVRDGVSTYRAILQFEAQDERIRPGMTANIVITTLRKQDVLSVPQGVVTSRDGKQFVSVEEGEGVTEREVETGSVSSSGYVEIVSGLSPGDVVILETETN